MDINFDKNKNLMILEDLSNQSISEFLHDFKYADKGKVINVEQDSKSITTKFEKGYVIKQEMDCIRFFLPMDALPLN